MACHYFSEDYVGFCSASEFSYVPGISEMEELCFKNFRSCPIYLEFQETNTPVPKNNVRQGILIR